MHMIHSDLLAEIEYIYVFISVQYNQVTISVSLAYESFVSTEKADPLPQG